MKSIVFVLLAFFCVNHSFSQKIKNSFFALHNIIRGDSTYNTFDKQVALIKSAGYDGIEINGIESFEGMKAALDKHGFPASYFYLRINLDSPYLDKRLENFIHQLKGSQTIVSPFFISSRKLNAGGRKADSTVMHILKSLSGLAEKSGLQVAIYPHLGYYVERTDHALSIVKAVNRKNVGLSFNLCHWLATTQPQERSQLKPHLRQLRPYLKMITISGANDTKSQKQNVWEDYILPLGSGSFDTYGLVKYCVTDLKLKTPIGVQCYNIQTDKYQLVHHTMEVWKEYKQRLASGN